MLVEFASTTTITTVADASESVELVAYLNDLTITMTTIAFEIALSLIGVPIRN